MLDEPFGKDLTALWLRLRTNGVKPGPRSSSVYLNIWVFIPNRIAALVQAPSALMGARQNSPRPASAS